MLCGKAARSDELAGHGCDSATEQKGVVSGVLYAEIGEVFHQCVFNWDEYVELSSDNAGFTRVF